jgi:hypothetical protein
MKPPEMLKVPILTKQKMKTILIIQLKINNKPSIMKKVLLLAIFAVTMQLVHAQDLKKVQTVYILNKFDDAKTEIDKVMADPKLNTKPEALFWKARVYATLYKDTLLRAKYPNATKDAEDAIKNYMAADPTFAQVKEKGADAFFDLQSGLFLDGIRAFNKKNWELASSDFKSSIELSDVMFKNKWTDTKMTFDSTSVLYLAYAYQNGGKPAEAIKYYTRLADNKATGINGESIEDSYKFIVNYYSTQKDEANFKKYVGVARELFPKFPADEFEIDYLDNNYTLQQKADLFDKDDAAGTMSEQKYLTFGDIFVHAKDKEKLDSATGIKYTQKAGEAFKKAFAKNPQNAIAAFNVGIIYYNIYSAYDDKHAYNIRSMQAINSANAEKPAEKDPKKKAAADAALKAKLDPFKAANVELEKPMMDNLDVSLEWLEKSYTILKDKPQKTNTEKNITAKSVDFLANLYAYKRDRLKGKDQKAFEQYDAKYKMYDDLHGKP